jgi:hypothetical protein
LPEEYTQSPSHVFPSDGVYDVTHTVTDGCVTDVEVLMIVVNCAASSACPCPAGGGLNIGSTGIETRLSQNLPWGTFFSGCVAISGTLICDVPGLVTFSSADVSMQPGSAIIVEQGHLRIRGSSYLHGCNAMWQGIRVGNGAQVSVGESSTIEDACMVIHADEGSTINISSATFNRNLIGLYSDEDFNLATLSEMTFDCTSALSGPLPMQYSEAGIKVLNGNLLDIGVNGLSKNEFKNLNNGIIAFNKSVMVQNTTFSNIKQQGSDAYPLLGYGIYAHAHGVSPISPFTFTQTGLGSTASFSDCTTGIYVNAMTADISANTMNGMKDGIITEFCHQNIDIHDNTINCTSTGIEMSQSDPISNRHIHDNIITLTAKGAGIYVGGVLNVRLPF